MPTSLVFDHRLCRQHSLRFSPHAGRGTRARKGRERKGRRMPYASRNPCRWPPAERANDLCFSETALLRFSGLFTPSLLALLVPFQRRRTSPEAGRRLVGCFEIVVDQRNVQKYCPHRRLLPDGLLAPLARKLLATRCRKNVFFLLNHALAKVGNCEKKKRSKHQRGEKGKERGESEKMRNGKKGKRGGRKKKEKQTRDGPRERDGKERRREFTRRVSKNLALRKGVPCGVGIDTRYTPCVGGGAVLVP